MHKNHNNKKTLNTKANVEHYIYALIRVQNHVYITNEKKLNFNFFKNFLTIK